MKTDKKELAKKILVEISRVILGLTFMFSGIVKAIDPLGTTYKIQDYLISFGLSSLYPLAIVLSIGLCVLEFSAGAFMLFGIYRKWTARVLLLIMAFMTPFTLYLAIANPVSDCGCFGDALIITNWETFFKNTVLLVAAIVTVFVHEKIQNFFTGKFYWLVGLFIVGFTTCFTLYNYIYEPLIDFRPYKIGANLPQLMSVEEGKGDVYENVFIYEKDGKKEEFTDKNYPWKDSTWVFVSRTNKLIKEGEKPLIKDFEINRLYFNADKTKIEEQENITTEVLEDEGYTFFMISYSLSEMNETYLSKLEDVKNYANDNAYKFLCLTASSEDEITKREKENSNNFNYCLTDERTLKTMIRSNPGLILMKNGVIVNKWTGSDIPSEEVLTKPIEALDFGKPIDMKVQDRSSILSILGVFAIPLLAMKSFDVLFYRKRKKEKENIQ